MEYEVKGWEREGGVEFLKKIGVRPGQTLLDFGTRTGRYAIPAAIIIGGKGIVYALDKNPESLDELMQKARSEGLDNITRISTSGELKIPLECETVDAVLIYDVIHLIGWKENERRSTRKDRESLYKEIQRVAKPKTIVSVYPSHLDTHTDISSDEDVREEIEDSGFVFEKDFHEKIVHDDKLIQGHILNFRKQ